MNLLVPILIVYIIAYFIYKLFSLYARRRERIMIIEKLSQNVGEADSKLIGNLLEANAASQGSYSSLRIAMLLIGVGLGFLVGMFLQPQFVENMQNAIQSNLTSNYGARDMYDFIPFIGACIFGGVGLLLSYFVEQKARKK